MENTNLSIVSKLLNEIENLKIQVDRIKQNNDELIQKLQWCLDILDEIDPKLVSDSNTIEWCNKLTELRALYCCPNLELNTITKNP